MLTSPLNLLLFFTKSTVILFLFIFDKASVAKIVSFTKLGFLVIMSSAFIKLKFLYFATALEQSPSVIIDIFLDLLFFIKTQPSLFEARTDSIFENEHLLLTKGIFFPFAVNERNIFSSNQKVFNWR